MKPEQSTMISPAISPIRSVALISTYFENPGDDIIRYGTMALMRQLFGQSLTFIHIAKSNSLCHYGQVNRVTHGPTHHMPRLARWLIDRIGRIIRSSLLENKISRTARADLIVIAGTPILYDLPYGTFDELEPWIEHTLNNPSALKNSKPLLALGLGSIVPDSGRALLSKVGARRLIEQLINRCTLVTTRDTVTYSMLSSVAQTMRVGEKIQRSCCPALWAFDELKVRPVPEPTPGKIVFIFSTESARWDRNAKIVVEHRYTVAQGLIKQLRDQGKQPVLVAYNPEDIRAQRKLSDLCYLTCNPAVDAQGLLHALADAELVVTWRVHGALGAASLGVPAMLFQTDNRADMARDYEQITVLDDRIDTVQEISDRLEKALINAPRERSQLLKKVEARRAKEYEHLRRHLCSRMETPKETEFRQPIVKVTE